jgi:hypothetical protein
MLKHKMLKYCMGALADKLELPGDMRDQMHCVLQSHGKYRECLHPREETAKLPDLTWRAGWPRSAIMFLSFVEGLVYGEDYDAALRIAVRSSKAPIDVMEYDSISSKWADILETRKKEREAKDGSPAAAAGDGDTAAGQSRMRDEDGRASATAAAGADAAGDEGATDKLQQEAERTVNSNILLVVEPESQTELKQKIMSSYFGKIAGTEHKECPLPPVLVACNFAVSLNPSLYFGLGVPSNVPCLSHHASRRYSRLPTKRYVVVVYDVKQASESKTAPHLRVAPLRDVRLRKLICATIDARRQAAAVETLQLMPGDMYFLFDGKRPKNAYKLKGAFVGEGEGETMLQKKDRELQLIYTEKGLAERKYINRRGAASIKQSERVHMITKHRPKLPTRRRRHFPGTNLGDTITEIPVLGHDEMWRLPLDKKRRLYDKYRVDVGGKDGSSSDSGDDAAAAADDDDDGAAAKAPNSTVNLPPPPPPPLRFPILPISTYP